MACSFFDMDLEVYMVKVSYQQKPYRRIIMENYGATVYASPSDHTHYGQSLLAKTPTLPARCASPSPKPCKWPLPAVASRSTAWAPCSATCSPKDQSFIGQETLQQMELAGEYPDFVIGCAGGGTLCDFAGLAYALLRQNLTAGKTSKTRTPVSRTVRGG
jgi:tryptophan synthase beta chain